MLRTCVIWIHMRRGRQGMQTTEEALGVLLPGVDVLGPVLLGLFFFLVLRIVSTAKRFDNV